MFHESLRVHEVQKMLDPAPRSAEVWVVDRWGNALPASTVFRSIGGDERPRVYVVCRPWLEIKPEEGAA